MTVDQRLEYMIKKKSLCASSLSKGSLCCGLFVSGCWEHRIYTTSTPSLAWAECKRGPQRISGCSYRYIDSWPSLSDIIRILFCLSKRFLPSARRMRGWIPGKKNPRRAVRHWRVFFFFFFSIVSTKCSDFHIQRTGVVSFNYTTKTMIHFSPLRPAKVIFFSFIRSSFCVLFFLLKQIRCANPLL